MFANGPDQQFYQTPAPPPPPPSQQAQPAQPQQHQSVIVRQPDLPDEPDDAGYAASASYYGLAPSAVMPNAYPTPYNMNMPIPFLFGDWNQLGMTFFCSNTANASYQLLPANWPISINRAGIDRQQLITMSRHPYDKEQRPSCSYQPRPTCKFTQPSPADSSCSSTLAPPLTSPIGNPAIGNRLNPLAQPGFGYPRGPLQYDLNPQYMGGARKSGGRRPKEFEMGPEIEDQDEMDKRIKRRQRNKEAAARCRQRRLDLMTSLQEQVDKFKAENEKKEMEIRAMKSQMEQMHSFLRSHDCKLSVEEREQLPLLNMQSVRSTMPPLMNGISSSPHPSLSEYRLNISEVDRKRVLPAPQLPAHSDANFLEPDIKCPKIEKDVSLADLNGDTIARPNHINFDMIGLGSTNIPLSTPSNITYTTGTTPYTSAGPYGTGFPGLNNDFLNDNTGLTPSTTQPHPIFVNTPTPLQSSEADLRAL